MADTPTTPVKVATPPAPPRSVFDIDLVYSRSHQEQPGLGKPSFVVKFNGALGAAEIRVIGQHPELAEVFKSEQKYKLTITPIK